MEFESPDVEKDFPGLYASESGKRSNESDCKYSKQLYTPQPMVRNKAVVKTINSIVIQRGKLQYNIHPTKVLSRC